MERKASILIVEDEILSAIYLEDRLVKQNFKVVKTVANGEDAIKAAIEMHPEVILMDIRLAGHMDGIEAAKRIMEVYKPKVVFMTGYRSDEIKNSIEISENYIILEKPLKISDMVNFIDN